MRLGVHVSIAGSIDKVVDRAQTLGCNTFQIFTRSTRSWSYKKLNLEKVKLFKNKLRVSGIKPVFSHMPYLPNLASPDNKTQQHRCLAMREVQDLGGLIDHHHPEGN